MFYNNAIGRVSWQAGEVWDEALESIAPALEALSVAIQEVLQSTDMRSPFLGGGVSKKLRRAVLDSAAWSRDLLVVLVGHFHGAVRVKSNMLTCRDSLSLSPSNFTSDAAFKAAVKEAALREQNRAANTYSFLRQKDRAQSERFLSSFFNKASEFQIALLDESSGEPLSHEAMLDLLVEDMMSRASNDFPADARSLQETDLLVSDVRSRGGFDLHDDSWSEPIQDSFYTLEELDDVLQKCHSSKKCLHGCFSLLKSSQSSHRKVVLGLANLSRHVGLTSSLWSLRQFAHIRKSGARIVRKVQCLRPISLVADMAHVIDGLWLARNRSKLESFAGPNQVGGVSATNLLLLAILLLAQARDYQGLPLYLAILDLRWAFDVARLSSMKLACFQAGVRGTDWLLLDDVLDSDRQYVQLHGFLSHVFRLGCGIAQGRRFSVHVFNSLLSWLRDEIQQVTAANTSAWLPKYAIRALAHVDLEASHVDFYSRPSPVDALEPCVSRLQELMANAPTQASAELQTMINSLGSYADKCALLDAIGSFSLGPLQYVDDATVPCSSPGAVRAIVNKGGASACSRYAARTKAQFNYGKNKTCAMALLNSPPLDHEALDCDVVDQKHILGVLFDSQLTFLPLLSQSLARGWSMFVDLFHTAETGGFSVPVLSSQVQIRLHPVVLHAAPFLVGVAGVLSKLNQLQWRWGKAILGCRYQRELRQHLVFAQCGWDLRLGSCLLLEVALTLARVQLLPEEHPTARLALLLDELPCRTWFSQARDLLHQSGLPRPIPNLENSGVCSAAQIHEARRDRALRKQILQTYRRNTVKPLLQEYDRMHLVSCTHEYIPAFGFSLFELDFYVVPLQWELFDSCSVKEAWFNYRAWSIVRISGRWPLPLLGISELPRHITCPACNLPEASVFHMLGRCPSSREPLQRLLQHIPVTASTVERPCEFLRALFGDPTTWRASQEFVGSCLRAVFMSAL